MRAHVIDDNQFPEERGRATRPRAFTDLQTLDSIVEETKKEEEALEKLSAKASNIVDERLRMAYKKIRDNARNGLEQGRSRHIDTQW